MRPWVEELYELRLQLDAQRVCVFVLPMQGPVSVVIDAVTALYPYGGGVIPASTCSANASYDHAVLVVGYDRINMFWKVQNSW